MGNGLAHDMLAHRRAVSFHPVAGRPGAPAVLVICDDAAVYSRLKRALPAAIGARWVKSASDTEGIGARVVVIAGTFPLAELVEVRAHPELCSIPVVLFAPRRELPALDWQSLRIWPVATARDPFGELCDFIQQVLNGTESNPGVAAGS